MTNGYYEMLRKKIDESIASEKNKELKDLMERIDQDIYEMEFLTIEDLYTYGYRLVDFLQEEIALIRQQLAITQFTRKEIRKENKKKLDDIAKMWNEVTKSIPEITRIFSMSDEELSIYLMETLKKDELESLAEKEENE